MLKHRKSNNKREVRDPVCGMIIDYNGSAGRSVYKNEIYFFCAPGCLKAFNISPERYLGDGGVVENLSNVINDEKE